MIDHPVVRTMEEGLAQARKVGDDRIVLKCRRWLLALGEEDEPAWIGTYDESRQDVIEELLMEAIPRASTPEDGAYLPLLLGCLFDVDDAPRLERILDERGSEALLQDIVERHGGGPRLRVVGGTAVTDPCVAFLQRLRPGGPWVLTGIKPDGPIETITAEKDAAVRAFVAKWDGKRGLYYSVNPTLTVMASKARKADILAVEYMLADLDPRDDETPEEAKARYLAALEAFEPQPTFVVDSGNGIQALWRLAEPVGPEGFADVEERIKVLIVALGGGAGTQNVDRILRLPGTINPPNKKKIKAGRVACPTGLIHASDAVSPLSAFPLAPAQAGVTEGKSPAGPAPALDEVIKFGCYERYPSRSHAVWFVVNEAKRHGWADERILATLLDRNNRISDHIYDQPNPQEYAAAQVAKVPGAIRIVAGEADRMATEAEDALIAGGAPFYVRAGAIVRPIVEEVDGAHGRRTKAARLTSVSSGALLDWLSRLSRWEKLDGRSKKVAAGEPVA